MRCSTKVFFVALGLACLAVPCQASALKSTAASTAASAANPIRKVVTMLQAMQKKVEEEGKKEKELYEKFMCYCSSGFNDLKASVDAAEDKVPALGSDLKASEGKELQNRADVRQAMGERDAASKAMEEARAIRKKEHEDYVAYKADAEVNTKAVLQAAKALQQGVDGGAFLQSDPASANTLKRLAKEASGDLLGDEDREELLSFLSGSQGSDYAPQSGGILGILKQMGESMTKALHDADTAEDEALRSYEGLIKAKTKDMRALQASIEAKTEEIGELGVDIVEMKEDLEDSEGALAKDKAFVAELEKSCKTKTREWKLRQRTRAEELVALADTIKALNDDDALDLFKKTLPSASASLLQVKVSYKAERSRALHAIRRAQTVALEQDRAGLSMLTLALAGKKSLSQGGLDKVIKMCDEMLEILKTDQQNDDRKKEYCVSELDASEDKKKTLERTVAKEHNFIQTTKEAIATTIDEMEALNKGIGRLDRSVAQATDQRKKEHAEFSEIMQADTAAKELLVFAKNRLNKFYNPKELEKEESAAAFVQLSTHKDAPLPPPETFGAYSKKSAESGGVISMIDLLLRDLEKDMTEADVEEKDAQNDYEAMMKESTEKRTTDSTSLRQKSSAKADMESALEESKEHKKSAQKEVLATAKYISNLHGECDWLLQYYDVRKEARGGEIDAISKAKNVLSGSDYSLVQTRAHSFLGRTAKVA